MSSSEVDNSGQMPSIDSFAVCSTQRRSPLRPLGHRHPIVNKLHKLTNVSHSYNDTLGPETKTYIALWVFPVKGLPGDGTGDANEMLIC